MHYSILPTISTLVNEKQEKLFIKPITEGKWLGSASMSEPGTGSRLWHMISYATKNNNEYIINSFKSFCTSNNFNNFYLVPVRVSKDAKSNELSIFIVESTNKDVHIIGKWDAMGLRGTSSNPVHFKDCKVPPINLLGDTENAFPLLLMSVLPIYLLGLSTVYLGIAQKAFDAAVSHVEKKIYVNNNEKGSEIETVQRYIGEMQIKLSTIRNTIYKLAKTLNGFNLYLDQLYQANLLKKSLNKIQDDSLFIELAEIKVAACEMSIEVTNKAVQICGGTGYIRGHVVEQCYRDARAGSIMGPSDDIMKVLIGKKVLGYPFPWEI
jgi:alkylation response protein AidB-like acyl-CoA dehydrogenase